MIGLTAPLLQTADGRKMGKTAAGAVCSPDKLSPFDRVFIIGGRRRY